MKTTEEDIILLVCKSIIQRTTPEEEALLKEWRQANPRNEETYQRMKNTVLLAGEYRKWQAIDLERPMHDMATRIKQRHPSRRMLPVWGRVLLVASMLFAVFCIGYLWNSPTSTTHTANQLDLAHMPAGKTTATLTVGNEPPITLGADTARNTRLIARQASQAKNRKAHINKLTTPRGGEFKIILEDSTEVWLNAESQLIYPEQFSTRERRVTLNGEAYFKVKKDSLRPFFVESSGMAVRVYGTEFNIQAYTEDKDIYTTLVSGSVSLCPLNNAKSELVLTPGHQAVFAKQGQTAYVHSVDTSIVTSWHHGYFSFEEQSLEQIMKTLSRWYNFDYQIQDKELANTIFKGNAPRYAELSEVLSILEKSGGIYFHVQGKKIIVTTN